MRTADTVDTVIADLTRRGDLWVPGPGLVALAGDTLELFRALERALAGPWREEGTPEWALPPALDFATLARAGTLASFPQWLTAVGHLGSDPDVLTAVSEAADPVQAARRAVQAEATALSPAVCWHVYARLAGRRLDHPMWVTCQGTCWRREVAGFVPLERGWAFTMREVVVVGAPDDVARLREGGRERALALARALGLRPRVAPATDPFYAPSARGRRLLQRVKGLKDELLLPVGPGPGGAERYVAAASFNDHERFFGEAFGISHGGATSPGGPAPSAASGCVAFGLERWLLAFLVAHGTRPEAWPDLPSRVFTGTAKPGLLGRPARPTTGGRIP